MTRVHLLGGSLLLFGCSQGASFGGGSDADFPDGASSDQSDGITGDAHASGACKVARQSYGPGPDSILGTADDVLTGDRTVAAIPGNALWSLSHETTYSGPGPDGVWDTVDDVIKSDLRVLPSHGSEADYLAYDAPGPDGVWGTKDDRIFGRRWLLLEGPATIDALETRHFSGSGPDGVWLTPDDVVDARETFERGDGMTKPRMRDLQYIGAGSDGVWGTADDQLTSTTDHYDNKGYFFNELSKAHQAAGWYRVKQNDNGYLFTNTLLVGAGPNQIWYDDDDTISVIAAIQCAAPAIDLRVLKQGGAGNWDVVSERLRYQWAAGSEACGDLCSGKVGNPVTPLTPN